LKKIEKIFAKKEKKLFSKKKQEFFFQIKYHNFFFQKKTEYFFSMIKRAMYLHLNWVVIYHMKMIWKKAGERKRRKINNKK
jgi:hypothetical protein